MASPLYVPVTKSVPGAGVDDSVTVQVAAEPVPARVQVAVGVKFTVPVGVVGVALVSVTVAVHDVV